MVPLEYSLLQVNFYLVLLRSYLCYPCFVTNEAVDFLKETFSTFDIDGEEDEEKQEISWQGSLIEHPHGLLLLFVLLLSSFLLLLRIFFINLEFGSQRSTKKLCLKPWTRKYGNARCNGGNISVCTYFGKKWGWWTSWG